MNLDAIKQQTTWNDAATSINSNFAKLLQAILALEGGGSDAGGGFDESQLEAYLVTNGYTTQAWVLAQKFLKEITSEQVIDALRYTPLNPSDADTKYAPLAGFNALKSDFDALYKALNDDVSGKINTWNEIVNFLDEYSGSQDLATILAGMEANTDSRLLTSTFNSFLSGDFAQLEEDVREMRDKDDELAGDIASNLSAIKTLQGYFTNGVANRAIADANGNTIGSYYTPIATYNAFVTAYNQKVQSYDKMFGDLQDKDEDLMSDIDGLQTLTSSHTTQISGLVTRMGAAETRISNNSDAVQEAVGLVTSLRNEYDLFEQSVEDRIRDMQDVDGEINESMSALKARKITAGLGLTGGGTLNEDVVLNIDSANDGIKVNADNILLNVVTDLTTDSATRALAASQGVLLNTRLSSVEGSYATLNNKVTNLGNHMDMVDKNILTFQTQIEDIDGRLVPIESWKTTTDAIVNALSTQVNDNKTNIEKILDWFDVDSSGNLYTTYNLYSTKEISANGLGQGTGGSGGGLIKSVLGSSALGTSLSADNTVVFNAHATNKVYADLMTLKGRVDNLDITSTSVNWDDTITSGKKIGTLTIDGLENILYAPASYSWEDISGKTSAKLISVLGYTPYNAANFTKADIKSTLGISDWALASSVPSTSEVTEGSRLYFTNARAIAAVLGSSAIGSTTAYPYWTGSAWATKTLPTKLSDFTDDVVAGKYLSLATGGTVKGDIYSTGKLSADGTGYYGSNITTNGYLSFGTVGKNIGSTDPTSSFRQTIFGDTTNGSRLRTFRSTANVGQFSSSYASGLAWATSDSHAYIAISPYASVKSIHVGGGDAGVIDWSAQLFHNQLNIIPGTSATYNIGSSSYKWKDMYLSGTAYVGSVQANGEVSANILNSSSDIRFKNRINDVALDLDTMANAPMFRFTWTNREDGRVQIGSSAQYWKGTEAKELVSIDDSDFHRLDYSTLGVLIGVSLAKKTKNHEDKIKELEMKVESLKQENRRLRYGN